MPSFLSSRSRLATAAILMGVLLVIYFKPFGRGSEVLTDVQGIQTLREQFNRDAGKTRLILLLSPT